MDATTIHTDAKTERKNQARFIPCVNCGNPMKGVFSHGTRALCETCDLDADKPEEE